jgi:hypothetical protein
MEAPMTLDEKGWVRLGLGIYIKKKKNNKVINIRILIGA